MPLLDFLFGSQESNCQKHIPATLHEYLRAKGLLDGQLHEYVSKENGFFRMQVAASSSQVTVMLENRASKNEYTFINKQLKDVEPNKKLEITLAEIVDKIHLNVTPESEFKLSPAKP